MRKTVYRRPNKPATMAVYRREDPHGLEPLRSSEVVAVDCFTECHVTPPEVAARMVNYLGWLGDIMTLEPQAGTGNLIQALYDAGLSPYELTAIERHSGLCEAVRRRFKDEQYIDPMNRCFLDYAKEAKGRIEFPRIIMNPPFRHVKQHMEAAISLLGPGGHDFASLVALVPVTYEHDEAEELERLPVDTFSTAKVYTKIIRIMRE
jgi:phospholipid N-methyltransferase